MAKVSLRGYITEIDRLIDNNQLDEAIAHCIHILNSHPKHVDTYRLLGKAFLERQRYRDAADMFMRVLAIYPDDFVAHIGISIVREEQSDLDYAIFHMERAFEVQPSNTAIQDELKRLYGKRDGVVPPKIRLTHPALARLYSKGDLIQQAVGELRVALNESPVRTDILAQLAELYTKDNQTNEAIESCNKLIEQLPYCFGALNVLTRLLPGTPFAQDVPMYQSRLNELDPYNAFKTSISQAVTEVPEDAVMIEPLIWSTDAQTAVNKADWASSMGINLVEPQQYDASTILIKSPEGEHLRVSDIPTQPKSRQPSSSIPINPQAIDLPEWMQSAGWSKSDQAIDDVPETSTKGQSLSQVLHEEQEGLRTSADTTALVDSSAFESPSSQHPTDALSDSPEPDTSPDVHKPSGDTDSLEPAASISPANIPEWLRSIAPAEISEIPLQSDQSALHMTDHTSDEAFKSIFLANSALDKTILQSSPPQESIKTFDEVAQDRLSTEVTPAREEPILPQSGLAESPAVNETQKVTKTTLKDEIAAEATSETMKQGIQESTAPSGTEFSEIDTLANLRMSFQSEEPSVTSAVSGPADTGALDLSSDLEETADQITNKPVEDIPDWLRNLGETTEKSQMVTEDNPRDELPAWLQDFEQKIDEQPVAPVPSQLEQNNDALPNNFQPDKLKTDSALDHLNIPESSVKFMTKKLPEIPSVESSESSKKEKVDSTAELKEVKPSVDDSSPAPKSAFTQGETSEATPRHDEEKAEEDEERPAWLSKLIGIDDIVIPSPATGREKVSEVASINKVTESIEDIPGATEAAWIMDVVSNKEAEQQDSEEPKIPEAIQPETFPETIPEPQPTFIPEEITMPESSDGEPIPDLSLIVEGLQAAWMSEHGEETATSKSDHPVTESPSHLDDVRDDTLDLKSSKAQESRIKEAQPEKSKPVVESPDRNQSTMPSQSLKQKSPPSVRHGPLPVIIPAEEILKDARTAYSHHVIEESLDRYVELINRNRLIDSVIEDLEEMADKNPSVADIWQTLGDAYTRRNKLELALSAYHKAEDLLK